jgi:hypothetical protein
MANTQSAVVILQNLKKKGLISFSIEEVESNEPFKFKVTVTHRGKTFVGLGTSPKKRVAKQLAARVALDDLTASQMKKAFDKTIKRFGWKSTIKSKGEKVCFRVTCSDGVYRDFEASTAREAIKEATDTLFVSAVEAAIAVIILSAMEE